MAGIYSTRFIGSGVIGAGDLTYTVPTAKVAIVDTIDLVIYSAPGGAGWGAAFLPGGDIFWSTGTAASGAAAYEGWRGRFVLLAGETLKLGLNGAGGMQATGYLLDA